MSPARRGKAVRHLMERFRVSERRACRVVGQHRSTQRLVRRVRGDEPAVVKRMLELSAKHPRHGYRFIAARLRAEGFRANDKRIWRLWRREGLKVPRHAKKRRRLGNAGNGIQRKRAERPNHVWSWDFVFDTTSRGRTLKWLVVIDEYTRECLVLHVAHQIKSEDVIDQLAALMVKRGAPAHIRSDNGPEFIAKAVRDWLARMDVETLYIEPGAPWQNAYVESFNSRLRDEFLSGEIFDHVLEARALTAAWRADYNLDRPHSALGYQPPAVFAAACEQAACATLQQPAHKLEEARPTHIAGGP